MLGSKTPGPGGGGPSSSSDEDYSLEKRGLLKDKGEFLLSPLSHVSSEDEASAPRAGNPSSPKRRRIDQPPHPAHKTGSPLRKENTLILPRPTPPAAPPAVPPAAPPTVTEVSDKSSKSNSESSEEEGIYEEIYSSDSSSDEEPMFPLSECFEKEYKAQERFEKGEILYKNYLSGQQQLGDHQKRLGEVKCSNSGSSLGSPGLRKPRTAANLDAMFPKNKCRDDAMEYYSMPHYREESESPGESGEPVRPNKPPQRRGGAKRRDQRAAEMSRRQILSCSSWFKEPDGTKVKMGSFRRIAGRGARDNFGTIVGPFGDHFGTILCDCWIKKKHENHQTSF